MKKIHSPIPQHLDQNQPFAIKVSGKHGASVCLGSLDGAPRRRKGSTPTCHVSKEVFYFPSAHIQTTDNGCMVQVTMILYFELTQVQLICDAIVVNAHAYVLFKRKLFEAWVDGKALASSSPVEGTT